jgi:hypothetical protein
MTAIPVTFVGYITYSDTSIGGGPMPGGPGAGSPPGIWPSPGAPTHPIVMPPGDGIPEGPIEWKTAWSPATGWIVVGIPTVPVPTPAAVSKPTVPPKA